MWPALLFAPVLLSFRSIEPSAEADEGWPRKYYRGGERNNVGAGTLASLQLRHSSIYAESTEKAYSTTQATTPDIPESPRLSFGPLALRHLDYFHHEVQAPLTPRPRAIQDRLFPPFCERRAPHPLEPSPRTKGSPYSFIQRSPFSSSSACFAEDHVLYIFSYPAYDHDSQSSSQGEKAWASLSHEAISLRFLGADQNPRVKPEEELPSTTNYFLGSDPSSWRTGVPNYSSLRFQEIYSGIDALFYTKEARLAFDVVLRSGADPLSIRLCFKGEGLEGAELDDEGNLVLRTRQGEIYLEAPHAYYKDTEDPIGSFFYLEGPEEVGIALEDHDRSREVVIDPAISYSSYAGGTLDDYGGAAAVDSSGAAYVAGFTFSSDFPTQYPFQGSWAGSWDVFVTKISPTAPCGSPPLSSDYAVEGSTQPGFEEWILPSNSDPTTAGQACLVLLTSSGPRGTYAYQVPPLSRVSIRLNDLIEDPEVSVRVDSYERRIYTERALYISSGNRQGAHLGRAQSLASASFTQYIPEGFTAQASETWILVANPSERDPAEIDLFLQTDGGQIPGPQNQQLPPQTTKTYKVNDFVPGSFFVGTTIAADRPVLAERASYLGHSGLKGATASPATSLLEDTWLLPEGATAGPFENWVLLSNPTSNHVNATVVFLTNSGASAPIPVHLMPQSRQTIGAEAYVDSYDVATLVNADYPIAAERPLYSRGHPSYGDTASSAEGLTYVSNVWLTPEGAARGIRDLDPHRQSLPFTYRCRICGLPDRDGHTPRPAELLPGAAEEGLL